MNDFEVTIRLDEYEEFQTDTIKFQSPCSDILNFIQEKERELKQLTSHATIIRIERIL